MDPDEARAGPVLLELGQRDPHQVAVVGGVQPGVVTLGLDVADLGDRHEAGDAASLDGHLLLGVLGARGGQDPAYGLGQTLGAHRLEHVVDGVELERVHGVLVVGGDEHGGRRRPEAGEDLAELDAGEPGHLDVEEHRVHLQVLQQPQRLGGGVGGMHLRDPFVLLEQVGQLVEGRALVVDDQHPQAAWPPGVFMR